MTLLRPHPKEPRRWRAWLQRRRKGRAAGERLPRRTVRAASSPTVHLDRLADALANKGLTTLPCYTDTPPRLRVYMPSATHVGETITADPGSHPDEWWFRTSTGILLGPHNDPASAAETLALLLGPWLPIAWGITPDRNVPEVRRRFPRISCWLTLARAIPKTRPRQ